MKKPLGFTDFLVLWCHQQNTGLPDVHRQIASWLEDMWQSGHKELVLLAFRSAGKSTLVGLYCAWLLFTNPNTRILVLAADQVLAGKLVRNTKRIIERHPATTHLRPKTADQWAADRFTVRRARELRDPSMLARGISGNITGSRADVVICDDVEVPNTCDSQTKRNDLRLRLAEIEFVLVPGGQQLYVGTPHSYFSIYAQEVRPETGEEHPFLNGFARLMIPIVDASGASVWPERFPLSKIEAMKRRAGPNKFTSQMLLRPVPITESRLDPARLVPYEGDLAYREGNKTAELSLMGQRLVSASCWWDPSYGSPGTGDASVVAVVFTDSTGTYYLHAIEYIKHDPARLHEVDEATQMCRKVASFARDYFVPAICIETNGVGRFLPGLLRKELALAKVPAAVREFSSHKPKDQRIIEAFDATLAAGALKAHKQIWSTPFILEMREWRAGRKQGRDDGLDAVSGCLLSEPVRIPRHYQMRHEAQSRMPWRGEGTQLAPHAFKV